MQTEKVRNEMGKTVTLKVKKNGKTIMMLDPEVITTKMEMLKFSGKTGSKPGVFSKVMNLLGKAKE